MRSFASTIALVCVLALATTPTTTNANANPMQSDIPVPIDLAALETAFMARTEKRVIGVHDYDQWHTAVQSFCSSVQTGTTKGCDHRQYHHLMTTLTKPFEGFFDPALPWCEVPFPFEPVGKSATGASRSFDEPSQPHGCVFTRADRIIVSFFFIQLTVFVSSSLAYNRERTSAI
jgi:hypothetical protein